MGARFAHPDLCGQVAYFRQFRRTGLCAATTFGFEFAMAPDFHLPGGTQCTMVSMHQVVFEVVESQDGGFEASALGHRIHTQGENWEDLKAMVQDAVRAHFPEADRPAMIRLLFVREEVLTA